jgi:chitinase
LLLTLLVGASVSAQGLRIRDTVPPTAPANLVVTAVTPNSVSLAWDPSTDNSFRFNYLVCCADATVTVSSSVTSVTLQNLDSGATYTLRVYAKDAAGNLSGSSNPVTVTLPNGATAPTSPVVMVTDVGPTHASLTWASTDDGPFIWYTIYLDGNAVLTTNAKSALFTPLEQETTYAFTVRARDVDGNWSPTSDPVFVTTEPPNPNDVTPPTAPANITTENNGHLVLHWTASSDDFAPQSLIRYDVYINGVLAAFVVGDTTVEVEPDPGQSTITIIAVDTADNESAPGTIVVNF